MSYYDSRDSRGYRVKRDRYSRPDGGYVEETYVDKRGGYPYDYDTRLVRRRGDSEESVVEEVSRDFPPGEYYYGYPGPRRASTVREGARRARSAGRDPYYDEEYYRREDYRPRRSKRSDGRRDRYERSAYSSSRSPSPRPRRRKSMGEEALGAIGGALGIKAARDRSRDRDRDSDRGRSRKYRSYSDSRSRSRGHRAKSEARIAQAMKAALAAGAAEAFRVRSIPGPWTGEKGRRVLTAAVSAGGVDGLIDRDPNKHGGRHVLESILAGMATNRLVNGARSNSRSRNGTRGRSQSRGGVRDLAAAGILAAAGKQAYDRFSRSHSRGRDRSDSRDSRDGGRDSKKRGSSVSRAINKGLAALGLDDKSQSDRGGHRSTRSSDYSDSGDDRSYRSSRRRRSSRDVRSQRSSSVSDSTSRVVAKRAGSSNGNIECHSDCDSDSDLNSDDEKREKKKMLRKELITSGLATVATIHAAHGVIKNVEAQKKRHEAVKSGAISKEQERTMQRKADLKNLASIGLAALGIKGAIGEWKEVQEQRKEHKEFEHKCQERHERRMRRAQSAGGSNRYSQESRSRAASAVAISHNGIHFIQTTYAASPAVAHQWQINCFYSICSASEGSSSSLHIYELGQFQSSVKSLANKNIQLYENAKDELEIATDSTNGATIYAASDRESARELFDQLLYVYNVYTDMTRSPASTSSEPPPQENEAALSPNAQQANADRLDAGARANPILDANEALSGNSYVGIAPNYDPEYISVDVKEEVKKRVGQRVRELKSAVERLEEMASHE
ncbi:hypothetical protein ZTR_01551 [Talaromyces verruculosus]|nr:hypothetical protein ZTR_01551 [Talaromyces verruculosus]